MKSYREGEAPAEPAQREPAEPFPIWLRRSLAPRETQIWKLLIITFLGPRRVELPQTTAARRGFEPLPRIRNRPLCLHSTEKQVG